MPAPAQTPAPATSDTPAPTNPPQVDPVFLKLYIDAMKDLKQLTSHRLTLKQKVDQSRRFSFSPDTKAGLQAVFGNDDPLHITVTDLPEGGATLHVNSDALDHTDAKTGSTLHFDPLVIDSVVNPDYNKVKFTLTEPGLKFGTSANPASVEVNNISASGDFAVGPYNFYVGKLTAKIDHFSGGNPDWFLFGMNDMRIDGETSVHKKLFDVSYDYRIASIDWSSDKVENAHIDLAFRNIDGQALDYFVNALDAMDPNAAPDEAQINEMAKGFKHFAVDLSRHNGVIELRDISAQYHGQTAGISGRISLPNLKTSDLDSFQKTFEKLVVRLKLHVPTQMIDDVSKRVTRSMMQAQAKQSGVEVTDMAVELVARGMVGNITDMLVKKQKWAHMEKDELVTVFELKRGKMYLDGHLVNAKSNPFVAMAQGK